jgi:hypothetical protein
VFTADDADRCHDWDNAVPFATERIEHVPRVLHHWRSGLPAPVPGRARAGLAALPQRTILQRQIAARADRENFEVVPCPVDRGVPELHVRRVRTRTRRDRRARDRERRGERRDRLGPARVLSVP